MLRFQVLCCGFRSFSSGKNCRRVACLSVALLLVARQAIYKLGYLFEPLKFLNAPQYWCISQSFSPDTYCHRFVTGSRRKRLQNRPTRRRSEHCKHAWHCGIRDSTSASRCSNRISRCASQSGAKMLRRHLRSCIVSVRVPRCRWPHWSLNLNQVWNATKASSSWLPGPESFPSTFSRSHRT